MSLARLSLFVVDRVAIAAGRVVPAAWRGGRSPDDHHRFQRTRAMHRAMARGDGGAVLREIDRGADPNGVDAAGRTPLLWALGRGDAELVDALLWRKASPDLRPEGRESPLETVIDAPEDAMPPACLDHLLRHRADVLSPSPEGEPPVLRALRRGRRNIAWRLVARGARLDAEDPRDGWSGVEQLLKDEHYDDLARLLYDPQQTARMPDALVVRLVRGFDPVAPVPWRPADPRKRADVRRMLVALRPSAFRYQAPTNSTLPPAVMRGFLDAMIEGRWVPGDGDRDACPEDREDREALGWMDAVDALNWRVAVQHETEFSGQPEAGRWERFRTLRYDVWIPARELEPGVAFLVKVLNSVGAHTAMSCAGHEDAPTARIWFDSGYALEWARFLLETASGGALALTVTPRVKETYSWSLGCLSFTAPSPTALLETTLPLAEAIYRDRARLRRLREAAVAQLPEDGVTAADFAAVVRTLAP